MEFYFNWILAILCVQINSTHKFSYYPIGGLKFKPCVYQKPIKKTITIKCPLYIEILPNIKNNFMQLAVAWIKSECGLPKSIADKQILLFVKERQTNVYHILRCRTTIKFGIETDGTSLEFVSHMPIESYYLSQKSVLRTWCRRWWADLRLRL